MPGIWGIITEKKFKHEIDLSDSFHKELGIDYLKDSEKFQKDKIFRKIEQNLICTEGITLNLKNLLKQYNAEEFGKLVIKLYNHYDWNFVDKLRGNFSIFLVLPPTGIV